MDLPSRVAKVASVLLFAAACGPVRLDPHTSLPGGPNLESFTLQPSGPVISGGRAGLPILPVDPNIYIDAEGYHLFYSSYFCWRDGRYVFSWDPAKPFDCNIEKVITSIAYAFSADRGLTWTFRQSPIVQPSATGFDSHRIETAFVFRIGDVLHLAYSGDGDFNGRRLTGRFQIGLARLVLGRQSVRAAVMDESRQFERRPTPLLPFDLRPGRFDHNVQEPSVTMGPDGLVLYYLGLGLRLPNEPIDAPGQNIEKVEVGRAVLDDQLTVISRSDMAVVLGVNMPEVRYFEGAYHLFGVTLKGGGEKGEAINYATSADGVRWSRPRIILSPGGVPGFNDWGLVAPTAAMEAGGVVLFHSAMGAESRPCFPVPPQERFGVPWAGNTKCMFPTVARAVAPRPRSLPIRDSVSR
jgi:hypothetical protein